jgi:hypothetical protein
LGISGFPLGGASLPSALTLGEPIRLASLQPLSYVFASGVSNRLNDSTVQADANRTLGDDAREIILAGAPCPERTLNRQQRPALSLGGGDDDIANPDGERTMALERRWPPRSEPILSIADGQLPLAQFQDALCRGRNGLWMRWGRFWLYDTVLDLEAYQRPSLRADADLSIAIMDGSSSRWLGILRDAGKPPIHRGADSPDEIPLNAGRLQRIRG